MIDQRIKEELAQLDDATILRRLPYSERTFFEYGFQRGYNRALKNLWHPASEAPRNDYTDILIVCKKPQHPIVLSLEDILDGAPDDIASYNDMWMHLCDVYKITKYCYIGDLLSKKGGENERA